MELEGLTMKARALLFVASLLSAMPLMGAGEEVPPGLLQGLSSEEFSVREKSQVDLLVWAREKPEIRAKVLFHLSIHADPEIRKRSAVILRELSDEDYLSDGQGYVGIMMTEEVLNAGPDGRAGAGMRINRVMKGSPADLAGLKFGDLIVALDGKTWHEPGAINVFMETVAGKKPLMDVVLTIRRDAAEPIEIKVKLGKRPISELQNALGSIEMMDRQAKDEHYRKWLKRQNLAQD